MPSVSFCFTTVLVLILIFCAGCLDSTGPQLRGEDPTTHVAYTVSIGDVNSTKGNAPIDGRLFRVETPHAPREIRIVLGNTANTPLMVQGGGLRCKNSDANKAPPFEPQSYYFECLHCTNDVHCTTNGKTTSTPDGDGCSIERGDALYHIAAMREAVLVTAILASAGESGVADCVMELAADRGTLEIPFSIDYRLRP